MQAARSGVAPAWSDERAEAALVGLHRRREARTRRRVVAAAVAVCAVLLVVVGWRAHRAPTARIDRPAVAAPARLLDGTTVTPIAPESSIVWREIAPSRVVLALERGHVRCDVHHDPSRVFRVEAGAVVVEVLGTAFDVERGDDDVRVTVQRGRVRVTAADAVRELAAGESGTFASRAEAAPAPPPSTSPPLVESAPPPRDEAPRPATSARAWRSLAEGGDFEDAYDAVRREGGARVVKDDVQDLLLFADVARHSRHPAEAVEPLRKVLKAHRDDPRASLAAFTLGRVLLDELGRPSEAAAAFADARALQPGGALAEDALAREVEAWSRAGETAKARELAQMYVDRYPYGARTRLVRRHGGLE